MNEIKEIEEMRKVVEAEQTYGIKYFPDQYEPFDINISNIDIARAFYNANYRKREETIKEVFDWHRKCYENCTKAVNG